MYVVDYVEPPEGIEIFAEAARPEVANTKKNVDPMIQKQQLQ